MLAAALRENVRNQAPSVILASMREAAGDRLTRPVGVFVGMGGILQVEAVGVK